MDRTKAIEEHFKTLYTQTGKKGRFLQTAELRIRQFVWLTQEWPSSLELATPALRIFKRDSFRVNQRCSMHFCFFFRRRLNDHDQSELPVYETTVIHTSHSTTEHSGSDQICLSWSIRNFNIPMPGNLTSILAAFVNLWESPIINLSLEKGRNSNLISLN